MKKAEQLAFVFPGQGSQSLGMLADLAAVKSSIRESFEEASSGVGLDLWELAQNGPEDRLNQTEFTQPVLLAASVAIWREWIASSSVEPVYLAGHSLGEYSALVCSGALGLAEAAVLVKERGRLMQSAVPAGKGAMAAVLGAEDELVLTVCAQVSSTEKVVSPANFNSPGQLVIAGDVAAVDEAIEVLATHGVRKIVKLPVSVPSHTPLMRAAADSLGQKMRGLSWQLPRIPVIQNADAQAFYSVVDIQNALMRQLYMPVLWSQCVRVLSGLGIRQVIECGPAKILTGLNKRIDKTLECRSLGSQSDFEAALLAVS